MNALSAFEWPISETVVERLGWVLLHSLWQFALVALLAGAIVRALRRGSAATRYGVLVAALAVSVAAPVATWFVLPGDIQSDQASGAMTAMGDSTDALTHRRGPILFESVPATPLAGQLNMASGATATGPSPDGALSNLASDQLEAASPAPASSPPKSSWSETAKTALRPWLAWIVIGWSLGVVICSLRPLLGWHTVRRLQRVGVSPVSDEVLAVMRRVSARLGLRHTVKVLQSTLAQVPVVVGYLRPVILLPVSLLTTIPAAQLEAILAHELAHVRRHDFVVNLLQTLIETLFFYHPAVWWLSRQIRIEREHCCDDLVVKLLGNRVEYGRALVAIEELRAKSFVLALSARDGSLLGRIRRLIPATEHERLPVWRQSPAATLLVFAGVIAASWSLTRATDDSRAEAEDLLPAPERSAAHDLPAAGPHAVRAVHGVVQDSRGERAAGITIVLRTQSGGIASTTHSPEPGTNLAQTVSDADGQFAFEGVRIRDLFDGDMRDGRTMPLDVVAFAAGRAIGWAHAEGPGQVIIKLKPTARLRGTVRNTAGLPIAGADVIVKYLMSIRHIAQADLEQGRWPRSDDRQFINLADSPSTRVAGLTDENGRFELDGVPDGSGVLLEVRHPDYRITNAYAATIEKLDPENATAAKRHVQVGDVQISLERGHHVAVRVVFDDTGEPAAFVKHPVPPYIHPPTATADAQGRFEFRHLLDGEFGLYVYAPAVSEYLAVRQTVELTAGTYEHDVTVRLPRGAVLAGRVIDDTTQNGIPEARLVWWSPEPDNIPSAPKTILSGQFSADDTGAFRVPVATGPVNVAIATTVEGYRPLQPYFHDFERSDPRLLRQLNVVKSAAPGPVVFALTRESSRHGIVFDPDGKPASNVEFAGRISLATEMYRNFRRKTGVDGTFELPDLFQITPEDNKRVSEFVGFRDPQHSLAGVVEIYSDDDPRKPVEVQLWATSAVRGRLLDRATGEPIRNLHVRLHAFPAGSRMSLDFLAVGPTSTNEDGEFSLNGLVPGVPYWVSPDNLNYIAEDPRLKFTAATDETDSGDLLLTPRPKPRAENRDAKRAPAEARQEPQTATVVGTVVTPDNQPVPGIEVLAFEGGKRLDQKFTTDELGQFRVPKAWRESDHYLTLVARDGRERLGWFDFFFHGHSENGQKSDDGSFRLVLLPLNHTVRGRLLDESGKPLAKVSVEIEYLQHEINFASAHWKHQKIGGESLVLGAITNDDGRFELKLPADSFAWLGTVHADWVHQRIQVAKEKDEVSAVRLVRAAKVAGRVIDSRTGKPLVGVGIGAQGIEPDMQSGGWGDAKTDADGKYVIGGLPSGEFDILLLDGADKTLTAPAYASATLKSGETYPADFALFVGRRLAGRVVDAQSDQPIPSCTVSYSGPARPGGAVISTETNEQGEFEFFVPPGQSHVYVAENRLTVAGQSSDFDVPADRDSELIILKAGAKSEVAGGGIKIFVGPPLDRKVSLHLQRTPLVEVLEKLCDSAAVKLELDDDGLKNLGYTKNILVTIDADRTTLRDALKQVLDPYEKLSFTLVDDSIFVSSREQVEIREKAAEAAARVSADKPVAKELEPFQGTWAMGLCDTETKAWNAPLEEVRKWTWTIMGNEIVWAGPESNTWKMSFTVDPNKSPRQIDFKFLSGPNKGATCLGLYEFEGKGLHICVQEPGAKLGRPTTFSFTGAGGRSRMFLSAAGPKSPVDDVQLLQGTWKFSVCQSRWWPVFRPTADAEFPNWRWTVKGDRMDWTGVSTGDLKVSFLLDPTQSPKQIDFTFLDGPHKGEKCLGVYKLNEGRFWVCVADPGAKVARPTDFSMETNGRRSLLILDPVAASIAKDNADAPMTLEAAVAAVNKQAAKQHLDVASDRMPAIPPEKWPAPVTVEEVVTAIRGWDRKKVPVADETYRIYERIADTKVLPPKATLDFRTQWLDSDQTDKFEYRVWVIQLDVFTTETTGFGYSIRNEVLDRRIAFRPSPRHFWIISPRRQLAVWQGLAYNGMVVKMEEDRDGGLLVIITRPLTEGGERARVVAFDDEGKRYDLVGLRFATSKPGLPDEQVFERFRLDPSKLAREKVLHVGIEAADPVDLQKASAPPKGLEFLVPYPKLHGLSLDMTEPQFLAIAENQKLKPQKTTDGGSTQYRIPTGDGHTVIVMFGKDNEKCKGIQRVRGEDPAAPAKADPRADKAANDKPERQDARVPAATGALLAAMIKKPSLAVLKQLLAVDGTKQPEPVELLDDGRMEQVKKGSDVKLIGDGADQIAIVSARVRPVIGDEGGVVENDFRRLPECAFVFDRQGRLMAALGGKIGTSRAISPSPERVEILSLGPVEDWFVRVTRFEFRGAFEHQSEYFRIANPIVNSLRYYHYANSNGWSFGPEKFSRFGTLRFDFPSAFDKLAPRAVGLTPDGVGVNPIIFWDGDRNRFVGAASQRSDNKPLYQVDTDWSRDFEPLAPKPDQLVVSGGARREEHWHSWRTVVPDKFEAVVTLTIPQHDGPPRVVRKTCRPGATILTLHDTPDGEVLAANLELCDLEKKREKFDLPHPLGDRPAAHPPIVQVLNPGESARLLNRPLAASSEALIVEIKLQSPD